MVSEWSSENKLTARVCVVEKSRNLLTQKLKRFVTELRPQYENAQRILNQNANNQNTPIDFRWIFGQQDANKNKSEKT